MAILSLVCVRDQGDYVDLMLNTRNREAISQEAKEKRISSCPDPEGGPADEVMHLLGVFKAQRAYKVGQPLNRTIIAWSREQLPHTEYHFFGMYIELSSIQPWISEIMSCYKCQGYGHVAKYCRKESACAACAEAHKTKDYPARNNEKDNGNEDVVTTVRRYGEQGVPL